MKSILIVDDGSHNRPLKEFFSSDQYVLHVCTPDLAPQKFIDLNPDLILGSLGKVVEHNPLIVTIRKLDRQVPTIMIGEADSRKYFMECGINRYFTHKDTIEAVRKAAGELIAELEEKIKKYGKDPILIVDDSITIRKQLNFALKKYEYDSIESSNGSDALKKLVEFPNIRLVILDINMPEMNGYEVLQIIKSSNFKHIPVIMLTTESEFHFIEKAKKIGAAAWITKPFEPTKLIAAVKKLFEMTETKKSS